MTAPDPAEELDRLSEEFLDALRSGQRPSIEAFATSRPHLADEIRRLFPTLMRMEGVKEVFDAASAPTGTQLGEYRLVREIGRGGMGVVYEAVQETMDRRVALKVLPSSMTRDPRFLERFRLEAKAAGRLQHPSVVPVIGIGEEAGVHYFAMQYIEGLGLDVLVRDVAERVGRDGAARPESDDGLVDRLLRAAPAVSETGSSTIAQLSSAPRADGARPEVGRTYFDNAVRLVLQAAEGVVAAHARGILHRDVKPSNLIVENEGKVWIADFGLCKAEDSDDLTHPDDLLGTLRYMPPERLGGESDVQGDVYGLGITLYELLTLRPAYPDDDQARLLARIAAEAPPRPRVLDPQIPKDLEAIVLQSMDRDRGRRYHTAEAFAADLRAHLEHRPIAARPPSFAYHLRAAIRRHRPLAAVLVLSAAVLVVGSVLYVRGLRRKEVETRRQSYVANVTAAQAALEIGDLSTALRMLAAAPVEHRGWEWSHLESRLDPCLRALRPEEGGTWAADYSPDGQWLAVASDDAVVCFADDTGEERYRLEIGSAPYHVRWSASGNHLVVATGEGIQVWRWPERVVEAAWAVAGAPVVFAITPDGERIVTGGRDGYLRVWRRADGFEDLAVPVRSQVKSLDVSPSGSRAVAGTWDGHATVWDLASGRAVWSQQAGHRGLHGVAFVGEAFVATPTEGPPVQIWHAADGRYVRTIARPFQAGANRVRASADGGLLVVGTQVSVSIYDTATWRELVTWRDATGVGGLAIHPSGSRIATLSDGSEVREWGVAGDADPSLLRGHVDDVQALAYHPSGRFLLTGGFGGARVWDTATGELCRAWLGNRWTVQCVAASPDGRVAATGGRMGDVVLWEWATDAIRHRLGGHEGGVRALAFSRDGTLLFAAAHDGTLHVWDVETGARVRSWRASEVDLTEVVAHPDEARVVTADRSGELVVWEIASGTRLRGVKAHEGAMTHAAFDAEGRRLATCSLDGTLRIWDAERLTPVRAVRGGPLTDVAFDPLGRRVAASGRDGNVRLWDPETGNLVHTWGRLHSWAYGVAFHPDGLQLAACDGAARVHLWDTRRLRDRAPDARGAFARRREAEHVVGEVVARGLDPVETIEAVRARDDLAPALREAALRAAHRNLGSRDGLIAYLWRALEPSEFPLEERWVARGLAWDLRRAAGHRNQQDRRPPTLWAALTVRCGDADAALPRLEQAMAFNEEREPYLFAVDLAFLTMAHAQRGDEVATAQAWTRLRKHVAAHPSVVDARLEAILQEARDAATR